MENSVRETVLVVEDDAGIAYLQSQSLQRAGFNAVCADSEAQAFEHLSAQAIDLIVLDYRLPRERTGLDLYADLKAAGHEQPVIMVTGFSDETTIIKAMRAGVRDFVSKSEEYLEYLPVAVERVLSQLRLEKALADSDKRLRQAQKMEAIGTLAGGVAHEFNNLLQAIQGYTRYAMEGLDPDDQRHKDLQQVISASERAAALTRQLLGFGRREVLQMTNVEPNALVRDLVKMLRPLIGEHIQIELSLDEKVGCVYADEGHLQQLIMNLCVNARDAMPHGGKLMIKTEDAQLTESYCDLYPELKSGRHLVLTVADTGCGMSPEVKEHIFEPFFTTKEVGKGTGLGLAMVYGVVKQHQGTVNVYSEVGIGTTFRIYLPIVRSGTTATEVATRPTANGGTEMILVAEDDSMVRDLTVRVLQRAGYRTLTAADGEQAVQVFEQNAGKISLAIFDVVMPRLSGRDAYQRIKHIEPSLRAIFCSGYDPDMAQVGFVMEDDLPLLQKPFDPDLLLQTIREVLDEAPCPVLI